MARGQKHYIEEFKNTIVELYNAGKSYGHIHEEVTTVFEFITKNKKYHDIKLMCKVLKVPRSLTINIYKSSKKCYGSVKINESLKKLGIKSIITKKYRHTSSKKIIEEQENILKRDFNVTTINEKWVTDITYIHTVKDGWCYLASVMDLYSRKIIGYAMSKSIDSTLAL